MSLLGLLGLLRQARQPLSRAVLPSGRTPALPGHVRRGFFSSKQDVPRDAARQVGKVFSTNNLGGCESSHALMAAQSSASKQLFAIWAAHDVM